MKNLILTAAGVALVFAAQSTFAGEIQKRANKEEKRIEHGEKSGKLTPKETERLKDQQETIDDERAKAMEDGKITKRERQDIKHDQKRLSQDIYHKKHNAKHVKKQQ